MTDPKIAGVKDLIGTGRIKSFSDIFIFIHKKPIATKLGIKYHRFLALVRNPADLRYRETIRMSKIFGISPLTLSGLVHTQLEERKSPKK
jgi:hypothetical protein